MYVKFYLGTSVIMLVLALILYYQARWIQNLLRSIAKHDLFFIPGVFEIALALGTLYYRSSAFLKWFPYLTGLLLFTDGILYVAASHRLRDNFVLFIEGEPRQLRPFAIITFLLALGYFFSGFKLK